MKEKYINFVLQNRFLIVSALMVCTLIFASGITKLQKDNSFDSMFPEGDEAVAYNDLVADIFNLKDRIVIQVYNPHGVLNAGTLQKIKFLSDTLAQLAQIESVRSLSTVEDIRIGDFMESVILYDEYTENTQNGVEGAVERFALAVDSTFLLEGGIISADKKATNIYVQPTYQLDNNDLAIHTYEQMNSIVESIGGDERIELSGFPIILPIMSKYMSLDIKRLLPLVFGVLALVLFAIFRNGRGVLLPISEVAFSLLWTLGLMGILGVRLTVIGIAIPILLLSIGVADDIYFLVEYQRVRKTVKTKREAVRRTLELLFVPHIITSFTTAVGFLSFAISDLRAIQHFGLFTAFGVFATLVFSLFMVPSLILILPEHDTDPSAETKKKIQFNTAYTWVYELVQKKQLLYVLLGVALVTVLFGSGIEIRHSAIEFFPEKSEVRIADDFMNSNFGGTAQLNVVFSGNPEQLKTAGFLSELEILQQRLEASDYVGYTLSTSDYIRRMNFAFNGRNIDSLCLPKDDNAIAQLLLLYEMSNPEMLENVNDPGMENMNVLVLINKNTTVAFNHVKDIVEKWKVDRSMTEHYADMEVNYGGFANINTMMIDRIVRTQVESIIIAVLAIFIILTLIYRSFFYAFMAIVPIVFAVSAMFAVMVAFEVPINLVTALISGIVIGIGIDYSIHMVTRFRMLDAIRQNRNNWLVLFKEVIQTTGNALLFNAASLSLGFSILLLSNFLPLRYLGGILGITMFVTCIGVILFIPYLAFSRRRKIDLATVQA